MSETPRHLAHGARLAELRLLRAHADLTPDESSELARLEREEPTRGSAARLIEALELAMISANAPESDANPARPRTDSGSESMPESLRGTLLRQAREHYAAGPGALMGLADAGAPASGAVAGRIGSTGAMGPLGWLAAAAAITVAAIAWWPTPTPATLPGSAIAAEIDRAADAITLAFKPGGDGIDAQFTTASAEVVWSDAQQRGYMRIRGIAPNDPALRQYQLWIVDPARDSKPVDGGVFDIASSGEVIIPFTSRLPVKNPAAFAITGERPGGVVVSAGPMLLVAARS
ncbi:MAG: anti-sigma factor [Phycisphaerales bacterium]